MKFSYLMEDKGICMGSSQLEWNDVVVHDGNQKQICFSVSRSNDHGAACCSSSSSNYLMATHQMGCLPPYKKPKSSPLAVSPKKPKISSSAHHAGNPCCQVEGCSVDLKEAKGYHRRHRICENHSKSPRVIVQGMESRFCQQCSRFHALSEFDDKKRSCRRRLSDHNARRRRLHVETIRLRPPHASSSFYDLMKMEQNGLLNRLPFSPPEPLDRRTICFSSNEMESPVSDHMIFLNASSLLSTNSGSTTYNPATARESFCHGNTVFATGSTGFPAMSGTSR